MKILWFTNTPSNASINSTAKDFRGGWISSLETLVSQSGIHDLGICFFYSGNVYSKVVEKNVVYYALPLKKRSALWRILSRFYSSFEDEETAYIDQVLNDFNPELIHVFGTENGFGKILQHQSVKVLFHLQGMVQPISESYFPQGFCKYKILRNSPVLSILRGITFLNKYDLLKKKGERERITIENGKYFSGRTSWDHNYVRLLNPEIKYFHCEELLRNEFYSGEWSAPYELHKDKEIIIGSTLNQNIYKGLDLIYKVLVLLRGYSVRWKVFGIKKDDQVNYVVKKILDKEPGKVNIEFHGPIDAPALIKNLQTCHFFVHPSYIDNSPNSVCEAMLLGMPVLASSVGGIPTLIDNGETGFLFNPYDKYDLAGLLINLIHDYDKAKASGSKARQVALQRHSPNAINSRLNEIYNAVIQDQIQNV